MYLKQVKSAVFVNFSKIASTVQSKLPTISNTLYDSPPKLGKKSVENLDHQTYPLF